MGDNKAQFLRTYVINLYHMLSLYEMKPFIWTLRRTDHEINFLEVSCLVLLFNETVAVASGKIDLVRPENLIFICYKIISVMIEFLLERKIDTVVNT